VIDSSAHLKGTCSLHSLWLSSTIIVSLFSSCVLLSTLPRWTLFRALPFIGDLLLEFYLLSGSISVSDNGLTIMVLGLPLWVPFIITAASAGVALVAARAIGGLSFISGIKWYSYGASYIAFTLLN
jgi:hypothetical protein